MISALLSPLGVVAGESVLIFLLTVVEFPFGGFPDFRLAWLGGARGVAFDNWLGRAGDGRFLLRGGWLQVVWVSFALQCQAFDHFFVVSKCQSLAGHDLIDARLGEEFPPGIRHFDLRRFLVYSTVITVPCCDVLGEHKENRLTCRF